MHKPTPVARPSNLTFAAACASVLLDGVSCSSFSLSLHRDVVAGVLTHDAAIACIKAGFRLPLGELNG
jgi:hypothetical protein